MRPFLWIFLLAASVFYVTQSFVLDSTDSNAQAASGYADLKMNDDQWTCFAYKHTRGNCWMMASPNCTTGHNCHGNKENKFNLCDASVCPDMHRRWSTTTHCDLYNGTCVDEKGCIPNYDGREHFICESDVAGDDCPVMCSCCNAAMPTPPAGFLDYLDPPITSATTTTTTPPPPTSTSPCPFYNGMCVDNSACALIPNVQVNVCSDPQQAGGFCPKSCNCCH